jgi:hypothetical protein
MAPTGPDRRGWIGAADGTIVDMKKLILLVIVIAVGAVVYKVLTTEVPIDEGS